MIRMTLIRHGKTYGNTLGRYIGVTDEPLCAEGEEEIRRIPEQERVELVFVSPLIRCRQTAELLYPCTKTVEIPELSECNFGEFENRNYQELRDNPNYQAWVDSMAALAFPGGESREEFRTRTLAGFEKAVDICIRRHYRNVACVAHGGTIMSVLEAYGRPTRSYFDWQVANGRGYRVFLPEKNWKAGRRELIVDGTIGPEEA